MISNISNQHSIDDLLRKTLQNSLIPLSNDTKQKLLNYTIYQIIKSSIIDNDNFISLSEEELLYIINNLFDNIVAIENPSDISLDNVVEQLKVRLKFINFQNNSVELPVQKNLSFAQLYGILSPKTFISEEDGD
jgi:hypothetical protein